MHQPIRRRRSRGEKKRVTCYIACAAVHSSLQPVARVCDHHEFYDTTFHNGATNSISPTVPVVQTVPGDSLPLSRHKNAVICGVILPRQSV